MTTRLRKAFINNLESADWMDYETKDAAREKVRHRGILKKYIIIKKKLNGKRKM